MIESVRGKTPVIGESVFLSSSSHIIGEVTIGDNCSIWYNTVLRGDVMPISIGSETNIQDGTVIHGTYNKCGATIGKRVTVGHSVILHGCTVEDLCLIGMGSLIMDLAKISERSIVAAGSLVTEESEFPPGVLILGRPAKAIRELNAEELKFLDVSADNYLKYKTWYK
ncbi:MAG: gamma carbonic anhydrase family protein [Bdellovibrionaceae bacterium]|nr:gamma carbonic anhydrase family protein [Pseudobdellovibrionaceae bacterium]